MPAAPSVPAQSEGTSTGMTEQDRIDDLADFTTSKRWGIGRAVSDRRHREYEQAEDAAAQKRAASSLNAPLWKVWHLLRPSWRAAFTTEAEAMGMFAVTLIRGYELKLQTEVVRALDGTLSSRSVPDFKAALLRGMLISVGGGVLRLVYGYLQARLSWKWRYKLTNLFHDKYFGEALPARPYQLLLRTAAVPCPGLPEQ